MLEYAEAKVNAKQLNETIHGKKIKHVVCGTSPHKFAFFNPDVDYNELLVGKTIGEARGLGGFVEINVEDATLLFGDGVNIRYFEDAKQLPNKYQFRIDFTDNSILIGSVQMYGGMWAFTHGTYDNPYYLVAQEKPDLLGDEFTLSYFTDIVANAKPTLSAKALLATEQRFPGLANGALQDILFHAGIHPKRKIKTFSEADIERLFDSVRTTLNSIVTLGGRDTEKDIFGTVGGYQTILSNKALKEPCPVCGSAKEKQNFLGGAIYFCPECQPLVD
ncbi:endonuclease VIII [Culicoidibacter larvae]|uniref:Endonuclease VIII n=1 Tax=Culicoidibacter larvae TaxID=2579976 RepID=A0A5R8Q7U7_9FIRM|nr:endonuclease VIII [Culicoidibacter larvae]TLG71550.1 endonuclease VIII [Culicoidibacter larvae]